MSSGLFSYLGGSIDNALASFVTRVSSALAVGIAPVVATGLTIWILMYGYAVMRHEVQDPINVFLGKVIKISLILAVALTGGLYQSEIVAGVSSLQNGLVTIVAPDMVSTTGGDIYAVLDAFDEKGVQMALVIIGRGASLLPLGGWMDLITGILIFAANAVLLLVCGGFIVMAKVATAFILGLGPMFIVCLAFPPVAKFFDAWLSKVLNYLLLVVILAFAIGLSMAICDAYMVKAMASMQADKSNQIADAFGMVILYGALLFVVFQAPHLASGLAGGSSLSGGGLVQMAAGAMLARKGGGGNKNSGDPKGGGSVENNSSGGGRGGGGGDSSPPQSSAPKVPAYRRVSRNNYGSKR